MILGLYLAPDLGSGATTMLCDPPCFALSHGWAFTCERQSTLPRRSLSLRVAACQAFASSWRASNSRCFVDPRTHTSYLYIYGPALCGHTNRFTTVTLSRLFTWRWHTICIYVIIILYILYIKYIDLDLYIDRNLNWCQTGRALVVNPISVCHWYRLSKIDR